MVLLWYLLAIANRKSHCLDISQFCRVTGGYGGQAGPGLGAGLGTGGVGPGGIGIGGIGPGGIGPGAGFGTTGLGAGNLSY